MSSKARPIVIEPPILVGGRVETRVTGGQAAPYLRTPSFWVDYGTGVDLRAVPPSQLIIPALGALLPLAVATGTEIVVPEVDAAFAAACDELATTLGEIYPCFRPEGFRLIGDRVEPGGRTPSGPDGAAGGAVLLFSGGVDSTASLIEHRDEVRDLVMVWGADIRLSDTDLWDRHLSFVTSAPLLADHNVVVARTNVGDLLDSLRLNRRFSRHFAHGTWWGAAQHGISLTTLTVPVAVAGGRNRTYIASSHTPESAMPWGSMPAIDDRVRWTGGRAVHDQYHLTRQMKLTDHVAPYVADGGRANLVVCYQTFRDFVGVNCGTCEKCLRTLAGIAATGTDPTRLGVPVYLQALRRARGALSSGEWHVLAAERTRWTVIRDRMAPDAALADLDPELRDFLIWLRTADLPLAPASSPGIRHWAALEGGYWGERIGRHLPTSVRRAIRSRLIPAYARGGRPPAGRTA